MTLSTPPPPGLYSTYDGPSHHASLYVIVWWEERQWIILQTPHHRTNRVSHMCVGEISFIPPPYTALKHSLLQFGIVNVLDYLPTTCTPRERGRLLPGPVGLLLISGQTGSDCRCHQLQIQTDTVSQQAGHTLADQGSSHVRDQGDQIGDESHRVGDQSGRTWLQRNRIQTQHS